ncbi:LPS export ABC transporter periplasmic protein LptC [Candidatus Electronema sp. TJ]|uniref:LPS export ABC transporter periplasmic protein LptC n=1 Tax=Candidatus Electronema sp. TJ TaxID=3401573 RepID=UPI003AA93659
MSGSLRNLLWLVPLGLLLSSPLWQGPAAEFLKPRGGYDAAAEQAYRQERQDFLMEDIVLTFCSKGQQTWTVKAAQARTGTTDREIDMAEVDALYSKQGDDPIKVTSRKGIYRMDAKHLTLLDDVVLVKPVQQEELRTELLHYYDADKMLVSPDKMRIDGPSLKLQGGGMKYDLTTKGYDFGGRVHVVM